MVLFIIAKLKHNVPAFSSLMELDTFNTRYFVCDDKQADSVQEYLNKVVQDETPKGEKTDYSVYRIKGGN